MTTLVRFREPPRNVAMNGEFERLIQTILESPTAPPLFPTRLAPPLDVWETEGELVTLDLPGIPEEKIDVEARGAP